MARTAVARRFNAQSYRDDALDMIKTNPELAANSMTELAGRKVRAENRVAKARNQATDAQEGAADLGGLITALVVMGATGWWAGSMDAKRDVLVADWELEGAESVGASVTQFPEPWNHERGVSDPTAWWMIPKLIVVPLGTGALAGILAAARNQNAPASWFERGMTFSAISTFGLVVAKVIGRIAYHRRKTKMLAEPASVISVLPAAAAS